MYGGDSVYIPMYNSVTIVDRNSNIVKEYNGRNIDDLRVRYGISDKQLKKYFDKWGKTYKKFILLRNYTSLLKYIIDVYIKNWYL